MTQHFGVLRFTEYRQRFMWLSEQEKLLCNLENLHQTCEQMAAKTQQLSKLMEEVQNNLADTRSLRIKLNRMAIEFDLALIPPRTTKLSDAS